MIKAKEVLKDKFWIVEEHGENVATISWDKENYSSEAIIELKKNLYEINKNIFAHNKVDLEINDKFLQCKVSTNDNYGLVKFLLLLDDEVEIIKINTSDNIKELLDVQKN